MRTERATVSEGELIEAEDDVRVGRVRSQRGSRMKILRWEVEMIGG